MYFFYTNKEIKRLPKLDDYSNELIERFEYEYLMKYWHFLKFAADDIIRGFNSKNDIYGDWKGLYGGEGQGGTSDFAVGAERIIYALLNGKMAGQPNSNPVSSDLFFEIDNAFIHIDLKTVITSDGGENDNIGDYNTSIFIGENQNSYKGTILKNGGRSSEAYNPNLPYYYTKSDGSKKICLTYFVTILNNANTMETELINIMSFPNGKLEHYYGSRPLKAGKNPGKTRFNFENVNSFENLPDKYKRVRIVYKNPKMSEYIKNRLSFQLDNFDF